MDNIHAPTVPSGSRMNGVNGTEPTTYPELVAAKEKIEAELRALSSVLDSHNVQMSTGLTTLDGFPRSDIDVAQSTWMPPSELADQNPKIKQNDYKSIMAKLEVAVHEQFQRLAAQGPSTSTELPSRPAAAEAPRAASNAASIRPNIPFARVNSVVEQSPAALAGLEVGDEVVQFGTVNWENHDNLRKVAETVQNSENRFLQVSVLRGTTNVILFLTPRSGWGGRGMLGCHLVPI